MKLSYPSPTQLAALGLVIKYNGGMTCASLGDELWGQWNKAKGSSSNPFSRPAGKVLAALIDLGYVERVREVHHIRFRATRAGEAAYKKDPMLQKWKGGRRR